MVHMDRYLKQALPGSLSLFRAAALSMAPLIAWYKSLH